MSSQLDPILQNTDQQLNAPLKVKVKEWFKGNWFLVVLFVYFIIFVVLILVSMGENLFDIPESATGHCGVVDHGIVSAVQIGASKNEIVDGYCTTGFNPIIVQDPNSLQTFNNINTDLQTDTPFLQICKKTVETTNNFCIGDTFVSDVVMTAHSPWPDLDDRCPSGFAPVPSGADPSLITHPVVTPPTTQQTNAVGLMLRDQDCQAQQFTFCYKLDTVYDLSGTPDVVTDLFMQYEVSGGVINECPPGTELASLTDTRDKCGLNPGRMRLCVTRGKMNIQPITS